MCNKTDAKLVQWVWYMDSLIVSGVGVSMGRHKGDSFVLCTQQIRWHGEKYFSHSDNSMEKNFCAMKWGVEFFFFF